MINAKTITLSILAIATLAAFIAWSEKRTQAMDEAYRAYENCVAAEYGTTPSAYYQTHGTTPTCR